MKHPDEQHIFTREIEIETSYAIQAIDEFHRLMASQGEPVSVFKALDDFLHHSARVSLFLKPVKKENGKAKDQRENLRRQRRGAALRRVLNVDEHDPLLSRTLRNHLQHLDERIDDYLEKNPPPAPIMDVLIDAEIDLDGQRLFALRQFDSQTQTYLFRGEPYEVSPLEASARRLLEKVRALPPFFPAASKPAKRSSSARGQTAT